jgi:hypothetical protein
MCSKGILKALSSLNDYFRIWIHLSSVQRRVRYLMCHIRQCVKLEERGKLLPPFFGASIEERNGNDARLPDSLSDTFPELWIGAIRTL